MTDSERKQRLAAALRENLKRRKAQAREAATTNVGDKDDQEKDRRQE